MSNKQVAFELCNNFYIRKVDQNNWGLCEKRTTKKGEEVEKIHGYYPDFFTAGKAALRTMSNAVESNSELKQLMIDFKVILERLEEIKEYDLNKNK